MSKRGQVTIFVIIGIIILASVFAFLSFNKETKTIAEEPLILNTEPITDWVEQCLITTTKEAIPENGYNGGYFQTQYNVPFFNNVPYYIYENESYLPTVELFQEQMQEYIYYYLDLCLDFSPFEKEGYVITSSIPESNVIITPNKIISNLIMNLEIKKGNYINEISQFRVEIPDQQLYYNIMAVNNVFSESKTESLCLSCFAEEGSKENLTFNIEPLENNTYLIQMQNHNYIFDFVDYTLNFMLKYEENE